MSNNSNGFYHLNAEISNSNLQKSNFNYRFRYILSNPFINDANSKYYLSGWFLNISYNKIEAGASRNILSGGYQDLNWDYFDAMLIPFTNKNLKYWDEINDFFIKYTSKKNKFVIFIEYGVPNRFFDGKDPAIYNKHSVGSNIGFRKYDAFDKMGLLLGAEYTRLVQGQFFDRIPTPNWYDNVKYNYSSYNGRRWGAHSGSDSDDLLLYFGHLDSKKSIIFGFNYERHGVTYIFPPEVKFEYRLSASYKIFNTFITINYENEYFEHYSFVDNSANVWNDDFEIGSVQRSRTLLLSLEKEIR